MKLVARMALAGIVSALLVGCINGPDTLTARTEPPRARLVNTPLPNVPPRPAEPAEPKVVVNDMGLVRPVIEEPVKGQYSFDVPPTVTQVHRQTGKYEQFILYWGQPKSTDIPFAIITVGPNLKPASEQPTSILKASSNRTYILNGLPAKEWTGYTTDHLPFCEIISRHDDKGDMVQAVAIARTPEIRQAALDILASIGWEESK